MHFIEVSIGPDSRTAPSSQSRTTSHTGYGATMNTIVSDFDIQALVDDELDDDDKIRVMSALRLNPGLKTRYEQLALQKKMIVAAWESELQSLH